MSFTAWSLRNLTKFFEIMALNIATNHVTHGFDVIYIILCLSKIWELPDRFFWHTLQKHSTSLTVLNKKFNHSYNFGSGNAAILLSVPDMILHGNISFSFWKKKKLRSPKNYKLFQPIV